MVATPPDAAIASGSIGIVPAASRNSAPCCGNSAIRNATTAPSLSVPLSVTAIAVPSLPDTFLPSVSGAVSFTVIAIVSSSSPSRPPPELPRSSVMTFSASAPM